ncbi:hypothetical protein LG943_23635 [Streptomonospora sp. S1-112]|uniref:TcpE family protein n=1 Tax=Streptomonospora mangrovi TaxID=2883123 RepID=A0A9X3NPU9_9ACTN|nr:TcpE family conjugal transfer membrane protein [Streptomonospora mangrovi]MDA0567287.1 hypothetical protein [Streptomonospora mangrovi]
MDLPTYTNIWRIEKRLYKLYDFRLPQPVSVVYLGVLLGVFAVWLTLMVLLGVPAETPWHVVWLVPPFVIAFLATRPVIEGKRLSELVVSQVRYVTEARVYTRLAPEREPGEVRVTVRVWHRDPAAGPLPAPGKRAARSAAQAAERGRARRRDRAAEAPVSTPAPRRTARQAPSLEEVLPASPNGSGARAHAGSGPADLPDPAPLWNGEQAAASGPREDYEKHEEYEKYDEAANWRAADPYVPAEPPPSVRERVAEREAAFGGGAEREPWEWEPAEPRAAGAGRRDRVEHADGLDEDDLRDDDLREAEREAAFDGGAEREPWEWEPAKPHAAGAGRRDRVEHADGLDEDRLREAEFWSERRNGFRPERAAGAEAAPARGRRAETEPEPEPEAFAAAAEPWPLPEADDDFPARERESLDQRREWERDYDRDRDRDRAAPRRGMGKKVLNYFGFALDKPAAGSAADRARRDPGAGRGHRPARGHTGPIPGAARTPAELAAHLADYTDERSPDHGVRPDQADRTGSEPATGHTDRLETEPAADHTDRPDPASATGYAVPERAPQRVEDQATPLFAPADPGAESAAPAEPAPDRGTTARRRAEEMMAAPPTPAEAPRGRGTDPAARPLADAGEPEAAEPRRSRDPDAADARQPSRHPEAADASQPSRAEDADTRSGAFGRARPWERRERPAATGSARDRAAGDDTASAADRPGPQRRLRGRIQGVLVTRRLERERDAAETASGVEQAPAEHDTERARERARAAEPPPRAKAQGLGAPESADATETPGPAETGRPSLRARRLQQRPHAAPWDLPTPLDSAAAEQRAQQEGAPAERPAPEAERAQEDREQGAPAEPGEAKPHLQLDHGTGEHESLSEVIRVFSAPPGTAGAVDQPAVRDDEDAAAEREPEAATEVEAEVTAPDTYAEDAQPPAARAAAEAAAEPEDDTKPPLQLDHGTGEHESLSEVTRALSTGTGEPERQGSAALPVQDDREESARPIRGGRDEAAEEAAAEARAARGDTAQARPEGKPPLQLDHGTGEHESLSEVTRAVAAPEDRTRPARATDPDATRPPSPDTAPAPDRARPENPAAADRARGGEVPEAGGEQPSPAESGAAGLRIPDLSAPKPALQLDHGTGEHESLSDVANAAATTPPHGDRPAERPTRAARRPSGARRAEESAAGSGTEAALDTPAEASRDASDVETPFHGDGGADRRAATVRQSGPETAADTSAEAPRGTSDVEAHPSGTRADERANEGRSSGARRAASAVPPAGDTADADVPDSAPDSSADVDTTGAAPDPVSPSPGGVSDDDGPEAATAVPPQDDTRGGSGSEAPREHHDEPRDRAASDRLEVLDRYLNHADTPPPPPPRFAEATGSQPPRRPVSWFADTPVPAPADRGPSASRAAESAGVESAPGSASDDDPRRVPDERHGSGRNAARDAAGHGGAHGPARTPRAAEHTDRADDTTSVDDPAMETGHAARAGGVPEPGPAEDSLDSRPHGDRHEPASTAHGAAPAHPDADRAASTDAPASADAASGGAAVRQAPRDQGGDLANAGRAAESPADRAGHGAESAPASASASAKPPLELDHGTGEHESFGHVNAPQRTTAADLEAAEAAAIRARRRDLAHNTGSSGQGDTADPGGDSASAQRQADPATGGERSMRLARTIRANPTGGQPSAAPGRTADPAAPRDSRDSAARDPETTDPDAPGAPPASPTRGGRTRTPATGDDNVFSRVAQNARRLSHLFGQTPPGTPPESAPAEGGRGRGDTRTRSGADTPAAGATGTAPGAPADSHADKPSLQLDHGTGEQQRLGDTPNGTPSHAQPARGGGAGRPAADSDSGATRGWRRLARVVTGGSTPAARSDLPPGDIERLRTALPAPRTVVVLGCTGGAGQTVTTLMLGHTLAAYRDERVVAVDVNPGGGGLSRRVRAETPETLTSLLANAEAVNGYLGMRRYTSQSPSGLEVVSTLDDPYVQTLDDRDYAGLAGLLEQFYEVALLDPAATGVARALPVADGMVLVAPASEDAARAVAMTFEWLDGHGYAALRSKAVVVINGVSKRSLADVDAAEQVARGRCRAIVRVPWDDHLAAGKVVDTGALRATTRRAHAALGGVLMHGLAAVPGPGAGPGAPGGGQGPRRAPEARR